MSKVVNLSDFQESKEFFTIKATEMVRNQQHLINTILKEILMQMCPVIFVVSTDILFFRSCG